MRFAILALLASLAWGCAAPYDDPNIPREYTLVPAGGRVTLDGKPLAQAWVTFLNVDEFGTTCSSATDEDGQYELSYRAEPGAAAANYKVGISYKVSKEGKPLTRAARMEPNRENGGLFAKELLPPENSNLGKTTLKATVPAQGGRINFDLKGPLLPLEPTGQPRPAAPEQPRPATTEASPG